MTKISNFSGFFTNPFNKTFDDVKQAGESANLSRAEKRANDLYSDKPFSKEYKGIANLSQILAIFAGLISFATALFALQSILFFTVGAALSWGLAVGLCLSFEVLKTLIWKVTAKNKLRYQKAVGGLIVTLIVLHLFSILSSGYGAYLIPSSFAPPVAQIDSLATGAQIAKTDILELQNIDKQLEATDKQISDLTPYILTPSGKKSSTTAKQINTLQAQKTALLAQKEAAKEVLKTTREKAEKAEINATTAHQQNTALVQIICVSFALFCELLYIVCTLFIFYYDFRVYIDSCATGAGAAQDAHLNDTHPQKTDAHLQKIDAHLPQNTPQPAPAANTPAPLEQPAPRKIGFFNSGEIDAHPPKTGENLHYIVVKNGAGYEILYNSAIINNAKNDIILARVAAKLYTKDRVNSNLTAAKNKAKNGEPAAAARVQFWGEIKAEIELYNNVVNVTPNIYLRKN